MTLNTEIQAKTAKILELEQCQRDLRASMEETASSHKSQVAELNETLRRRQSEAENATAEHARATTKLEQQLADTGLLESASLSFFIHSLVCVLTPIQSTAQKLAQSQQECSERAARVQELQQNLLKQESLVESLNVQLTDLNTQSQRKLERAASESAELRQELQSRNAKISELERAVQQSREESQRMMQSTQFKNEEFSQLLLRRTQEFDAAKAEHQQEATRMQASLADLRCVVSFFFVFLVIHFSRSAAHDSSSGGKLDESTKTCDERERSIQELQRTLQQHVAEIESLNARWQEDVASNHSLFCRINSSFLTCCLHRANSANDNTSRCKRNTRPRKKSCKTRLPRLPSWKRQHS